MKKNPAASVRDRLQVLHKQRGEVFDITLNRYALERLLYRLSQTEHAYHFLLKGGLLLNLLSKEPYRSTRDLDLLGHGEPDAEQLIALFKAACQWDFPEDGLTFANAMTSKPIKSGQKYPGIRVQLVAFLERTRIPLQVDIGFGDAVLKPYQKADFEPLLGFPRPDMHVYPAESVMAEKIHAMLFLGLATSRLKDIYDLWFLATLEAWSARRLSEAVQLTFLRRETALPTELPMMFTPRFWDDPMKLSQWRAFLKTVHAPVSTELPEILQQLQAFWWPLLQALQQGQRFDSVWDPASWHWLLDPASGAEAAQQTRRKRSSQPKEPE